MPTLRLVSVDAASFPDRAALSAAVAAESPQVVVVHHAPHLARWRSLAAEIARHAGLVVVGGGRTGGANLILSDLAVDVTGTRESLFARNPFRPTGVVVAGLRYRGAAFTVAAAAAGGPADEAALDAALDATPDDTQQGPVLISALSVDGVARRGTVVAGRVVVPRTVRVTAERTAGPLAVVDLDLASDLADDVAGDLDG